MNKAKELCDIASNSQKEFDKIYNSIIFVLTKEAEKGNKSVSVEIHPKDKQFSFNVLTNLYYHPQAQSLQNKLKTEGFSLSFMRPYFYTLSLFPRKPKDDEPIYIITIDFCSGC